MTVRVLFVCLGNICRSPMAEGVFQHVVQEAGLSDQITVDSAGTGSWHVGEQPHRGTRGVLRKHGIQYEHRARQITRQDFASFDYILTMDNSNLTNVKRMMPDNSDAEVRPFLDYAEDAGTKEVPDPYYDGRFEEVYDLVSQAAEGLLAHIRDEHGL
ncbi:MAG: low molecular weight phosphotyrosine protein phosphatase [Chloroflexi bacterium]|nr:low molecular weight phosphotyrosine protein phosphatase [Chloroflexota bacterium]